MIVRLGFEDVLEYKSGKVLCEINQSQKYRIARVDFQIKRLLAVQLHISIFCLIFYESTSTFKIMDIGLDRSFQLSARQGPLGSPFPITEIITAEFISHSEQIKRALFVKDRRDAVMVM